MSSNFFDESLPLACGLMAIDGRVLEGSPAFLALLKPEGEDKVAPWLADTIKQAMTEAYGEIRLPGNEEIKLALSALPDQPEMVLVMVAPDTCPPELCRACITTLARAIAQCRLAEAAQAEAQAHFNALSEQSQAGVYISEDNLICFANRGLARLFRFQRPEELAGLVSADDLVAPEEQPVVSEQRHLAAQAGAAQYSFTALRHDGSRFSAKVQERAILRGNHRAFLGVVTDVSEHQQIEAELERRASCDALTGLPNRTLLFDRLHRVIAHARRSDELFALLFLDLDGFKEVNERAGQDIGDNVLRIAAERFATTLRSSDTLARIGSDQFAVIAESLLFGDDVEPVAQKLCEALAAPITIAGEAFRLGVSIGIALFPASGDNADALYRAADAAKQIAKETRRGSYVFFGAK